MTAKLDLSAEHRAREFLHGIMLVTRCLEVTSTTDPQRRQWQQRVAESRRGLEALYAAGLDRDFLTLPH